VGIFHATVLFDIILAFGPGLTGPTAEYLVTASAVAGISGLFLHAVLGLILSLTLLVGKVELPALLKVFAALLLVCCVLQLAIVPAFINLVLFPIVLLVLAAFFLRGGHEVEIV